MKAARIHKYGPAEEIRIEDAPVPEIQPDEVLIKVSATSFNPLDVLLRSGAYHAVMPLQFPFTLSSDVSGIVEKTGAGVQNLKTGDRVYGMLGFTQNGAAAEYVVAKANVLAKAPATTDLEKAGGVPLVALTAWQGIVEHAKVKKGQRVFINAASGAVGAYAVQFSKQAGAYVIGSASPRNFDRSVLFCMIMITFSQFLFCCAHFIARGPATPGMHRKWIWMCRCNCTWLNPSKSAQL